MNQHTKGTLNEASPSRAEWPIRSAVSAARRTLLQLLFGFLVTLGATASLQAQEGGSGRIVGTIVSGETGQPLASAQVSVPSASRGTLTDARGRFILSSIPVGTHDLLVESLGFGGKTVTGVLVVDGDAALIDVTLDPSAVAIQGIVVTAERERGSASVMLDQQRTSVAVLDGAGAQEIARSPDSDAAQVARRLSGTTVTEGKYVFVRGLGERYSQTTLNGSPLPSPEPEREVVPLDLFPSGFLESLTTQKTYTPDLPADFTGGSVSIQTRDYPLNRQWKVSVSSSYNSESQFRDGYLNYTGGGLDFLGFDDGARGLPDAVSAAVGGLRGESSIRTLSPQQREVLGESFQRQFTPSSATTPGNMSVSGSYGQPMSIGGMELGLFAGANYSNSYKLRLGEVERKYTTAAFDPSMGAGEPEANVAYTFDKGIHDTRMGGVGNLTARFSPMHKIRLATTFSRAAEDEARSYFGVNHEDLSGEVQGNRLRFVARSLMSGQLSGEHQLPLKSTLEWRTALARARQEEPGLREAIYVRRFGSPEDAPFYLQKAGDSGRYFFSDVIDDDLSGGVDLKVPMGSANGGSSSIKVGASYRTRNRDFAARRFAWNFLSNSVLNIDQALSEASIVSRVTQPGEFSLDEVVEPGDLYFVDDTRAAGYAMVEVPVTSNLRLIGGVRAEQYNLLLTSRETVKADRDQLDLLPALNAVYALTDNMNVRAAFSRTLDRPEFREIAPFQFTEAASLRQVIGNSDLEVAEFQNFDARWEWYPRPGEVFSLGGFYKSFVDPIEQVYFAAASSAYSFQNAVDGRLFGVELDLQQRLDVFSEALSSFSLSGNLALIDSKVNVTSDGAFVPTNSRRPLEGQSPIVVNTGISYTHPEGLPEIGLFYNVSGKRLAAAGGSGVPDIYEMPRHQLDLSLSHSLPRGLRLRVSADNLLASKYRYEQADNGITVIQRQYDPGTTVSVGISTGS